METKVVPSQSAASTLNYTFSVHQRVQPLYNEQELFMPCCTLIVCQAQQVQKRLKVKGTQTCPPRKLLLGTNIYHSGALARLTQSLLARIKRIN